MLDPQKVFDNLTKVWKVPTDLPYFSGHFPGHPIFPGVAIVDASVELIRRGLSPDQRCERLGLVAVHSARFLHTISPADEVRIETRDLTAHGSGKSLWEINWSGGPASAPATTLLASIQLEVGVARPLAVESRRSEPAGNGDGEGAGARSIVEHRETFRVSDLVTFIPHRPPMVWIDRVTAYGKESGECFVEVKEGELYMNTKGLRPSACLELIAQSYGYCWICYVIRILDPESKGMGTAMVAAFKDARFSSEEDFRNVRPGDELLIRLTNVRRKGAITFFSGQVWHKGTLLAESQMRTFSQ